MNGFLNLPAPSIHANRKHRIASLIKLSLALMLAGGLAGCKQEELFTSPDALSAQAAKTGEAAASGSDVMKLREGDTLKITFPGSPSLDTTQQVRLDGKITMPLVGEVDAAGMTPPELERKLVDLYAPQLASKQVTVEVVTSTLTVYVTGMVQRPGKVVSDHPLSALDAVMEAGGFDFTKANLKNVVVIRREGNGMKNYNLNLKAVLEGKESKPFYLKPGDIVYIPERFSMF